MLAIFSYYFFSSACGIWRAASGGYFFGVSMSRSLGQQGSGCDIVAMCVLYRGLCEDHDFRPWDPPQEQAEQACHRGQAY